MNLNELWSLDPTDRISAVFFGDESLEAQAKSLFSALEEDIFLVRLKQQVWTLIQEESVDERLLSSKIKQILAENNAKELISNIAAKTYQHHFATSMRKNPLVSRIMTCRRSSDESLDHIREVRVSWETGILEELKAIMFEAKRPFAIIRERVEKCPYIENPSGGAPGGEKEQSVKFLFDSEDLMETVLSIRNPNLKSNAFDKTLGLMQLNLSVLTLESLPNRYTELSSGYSQLGVDDIQSSSQGLRLLSMRQDEGESILQAGSMQEAKRFLRRGCPPALRSRIWRLACGLSEKSSNVEEQAFLKLRYECDRLDLLTDELLMHDLQTVLDDPRFFVFEEELKEVLLSFTRDSYVRSHACYEIHCPLLKEMGSDFSPDTAAPPCGIQPYLGFSTYFAPVCYIYKHKPSLYHVTRYLYCNLWCKLNVLCSGSDTLLSLCQTFESLLMEAHPRLFLHLVNIGLQPLRVAFPWMQLAFIGLLEVDQLLNLWERIVGYMDPLLLAVAAVSIFVFRAEMLLRCGSENDAVNILMEGSRLHIVPLLQMMMIKDSR